MLDLILAGLINVQQIAQGTCGEPGYVVSMLEKQFGEKPLLTVSTEKSVIMLTFNAATASWTVTETVDNRMCIRSEGHGMILDVEFFNRVSGRSA